MRSCHPTPPSFERPLALLALGIVLCGMTAVSAQTAPGEPAEEVRSLLKAPFADPAKRNHSLRERVQALESLSDLRGALVLREWRDEDQDQRVAAVDRPNRLALAQRFERAVRDVLRNGDAASRLAVLNMLAEMGTTTHGVGTRHGIARGFGPDLAELAKQGEAGIREAAARTLGQIDPEPEVALPALSDLLSAEGLSQRLAAADGLVSWMRTEAQLATRGRNADGVEVPRADFAKLGRAVVPLAARGLRAEQPEIRRRSAQAIGHAAAALRDLVLAARSSEGVEDPDGAQQRTEEERAEVLPFILGLQDQAAALTHALVDADAEVRFLAGRALEDLGTAQLLSWQRAPRVAREGEETQPVILRPSSFNPISSSPKELEASQGTVLALAAGLSAADVQARRAALDALETLGPDAAPALAELVGALADPDKFVRWAAARTLGKIGPVEADAVAPALARLLTDADLDLRLAAAAALERWGPAAGAATADLCRTVRSTDAELRVAAIRALGAISGPDADPALPELIAAVADGDARVRQGAAQVLGKFGPAARDAVPALRQALQDDSPAVQKAAGEALLNILRPAKK